MPGVAVWGLGVGAVRDLAFAGTVGQLVELGGLVPVLSAGWLVLFATCTAESSANARERVATPVRMCVLPVEVGELVCCEQPNGGLAPPNEM